MIPLLVFLTIAAGTASAIAALSATMGWTVQSPGWTFLAMIAMWAPALGRFVARRTVDRGFTATLPLNTWGETGVQAILWPLAVPLIVYGVAYAIGSAAGFASWNPGGGKWTSTSQIVANVVINLALISVIGTIGALGEEIGWRGYLQPRLDAAGMRNSVAVVWLCEVAFHAPIIAGAGDVNSGSVITSLTLFALAALPTAFLWAHEAYRARSVWPAVFFHSFHNMISQWLFPKLFSGGDNELWLGESGILPAAGYLVAGMVLYLWMRSRGLRWPELARDALHHATVSRARS